MRNNKMAEEEQYKQILELFSKASESPDNEFRTKAEWESFHDKNRRITTSALKERLLGSSKSNAVKSIDEIAEALVKIGVSSDMDKARNIVPQLEKEGLCYCDKHYLQFEPATDRLGNKKYQVRIWYQGSAPD